MIILFEHSLTSSNVIAIIRDIKRPHNCLLIRRCIRIRQKSGDLKNVGNSSSQTQANYSIAKRSSGHKPSKTLTERHFTTYSNTTTELKQIWQTHVIFIAGYSFRIFSYCNIFLLFWQNHTISASF